MAEANALILLPDGLGVPEHGDVRVLLLDADGLDAGGGTIDDRLSTEIS
jgi:hypothetical protein